MILMLNFIGISLLERRFGGECVMRYFTYVIFFCIIFLVFLKGNIYELYFMNGVI